MAVKVISTIARLQHQVADFASLPTDVPQGSISYETDTGKRFILIASTWTQFAENIYANNILPLIDNSGSLGSAAFTYDIINVNTVLSGSVFLIEKVNADGDIAGDGQFWVKSDAPNTPYFTDDDGNDQRIMTANYGGLTVDLNTTPVTINLVDSYEKVTIFDTDLPEVVSNGDHTTDDIIVGATGDYGLKFCLGATPAGTNKTFEFIAFEIAASGSTITGVTQATPGVVTAVAHGFSTSNHIKFTGISGMTEMNNRIFKITKLTDDTFSLQDEEGVDIATGGFGAYSSGGTAFLTTRLTAVQSHRKFAAGDLGAMPGCGLVSLTKNNTVELWVKGITDATNITVEHCSFYLIKL